MKGFACATKRFFAEILSDAMLVALLFIPLVMGVIFRFGVPALEGYLCARLGWAAVLLPYYPLFDLVLCIMSPVMFTAAGALVILDEADMGLTKAISVTPVGRSGYLASRIGVPACIATAYCVVTTQVFKLSGLSAPCLLVLAVCSGVVSVAVALMIASMAKNKVEGLAFAKLSGLFVLGIPAAVLLPAPTKYAAAFLPTFWMTELVLGGNLWNAVPALVTAVLLCLLFAHFFGKKVLG